MNQNVIEILIQAKNQATAALKAAASEIAQVAATMAIAAAAITASLGVATAASVRFDEAMTNTASVLQLTREQQAALSEEILQLAQTSRYGANLTAQAYYDIAGGIADASTHMAVLEAAIRTAEAGNAALAGTTQALISVMNSYKFSADQAAYASDVLTRTVGMGVGTMDQFAAALPQVAGLARSLGIEFANLGSMTAYLTTKGNTASQATTQISAAMTAFLGPNENMKKALAELGYANGEAAVNALGLDVALKAVASTQTSANVGMYALVGSQEALRASTALLEQDYSKFFTTFTSGVEGATETARAIQMESAAYQFDLLKSAIESFQIALGDTLLPILTQFVSAVQPIILQMTEWVNNNKPLVTTILSLAGAFAALVPILFGASQVASILSTVMTFMSGPFGLIIKIVALVAAAFTTNFGGIRDFMLQSVFPVIGNIVELVAEVYKTLEPLLKDIYTLFEDTFGFIIDLLEPFFAALGSAIKIVTGFIRLLRGDTVGAMQAFADALPKSPAQLAYEGAKKRAEDIKAKHTAATTAAVEIPTFDYSQLLGTSTPSGSYAASNGVMYDDYFTWVAAQLKNSNPNFVIDNGKYIADVQPIAIASSSATLSVADDGVASSINNLSSSIQALKPPAVSAAAPVVNVATPAINLPAPNAPTVNVAPPSVLVNAPSIPVPQVILPAQPVPTLDTETTRRNDDMTRLLDRFVLNAQPSATTQQTNHYAITVQMPAAALDNPKAAQQAGQDFGAAIARELVRQGV